MKLSLIITTYNWSEALRLTLASVAQQTTQPHEIIIADDGSTDETREVIEQFRASSPVEVKHVWHEDEGFRRTVILNRAIREASGDYLVQIDGDILIERHFIEDHMAVARPRQFIRGGRAMVTEEQTRAIMEGDIETFTVAKATRRGVDHRLNSLRCRVLSALVTRVSKRVNNVKGCNMAYWKSDFVAINGYNNDICGWGHEDIEFAVRLHNSGVEMLRVKFRAITFHLHHSYVSRDKESENKSVFEIAREEGITTVKNGYDSL